MNQQDWKYKLFTIFYEVSNRTDYDSSTSVLSDTNNTVIYNNITGYDSFARFIGYFCNVKAIKPVLQTYNCILFTHTISSTTLLTSNCIISAHDSVTQSYNKTKPVKLKNCITDYNSIIEKPLSIYFNVYTGIQRDIDYNIYSKLLVNQYTNPCQIEYQPTVHNIYAVTLVNQNTNIICHKVVNNGYNVKFSRDMNINFAAMTHQLTNSSHNTASTINISNNIKSVTADSIISNHNPVINFGMSTCVHADTGIWWYRSIDSVTGSMYYADITLNLLKNILAKYNGDGINFVTNISSKTLQNIQNEINNTVSVFNDIICVKPKILQSQFNDYLNIFNVCNVKIAQIKSTEILNNIITTTLFNNTTVKVKEAKYHVAANANTTVAITKVIARNVNAFKNLKATDFCNFKLHNSDGTRVDNDSFANVVVKY